VVKLVIIAGPSGRTGSCGVKTGAPAPGRHVRPAN